MLIASGPGFSSASKSMRRRCAPAGPVFAVHVCTPLPSVLLLTLRPRNHEIIASGPNLYSLWFGGEKYPGLLCTVHATSAFGSPPPA